MAVVRLVRVCVGEGGGAGRRSDTFVGTEALSRVNYYDYIVWQTVEILMDDSDSTAVVSISHRTTGERSWILRPL